MRRHDLPPATVGDALTRRTVPELRVLAALIGSAKPQRKPEFVDEVERFLGCASCPGSAVSGI